MQGKKRIGPRIIVPLALRLFAGLALMGIVRLAIGVFTARYVMVNLLHLYPITRMLVPSGTAARGPSVAPAATSAE